MKVNELSVRTLEYDINLSGTAIRVNRVIELSGGEKITFSVDVKPGKEPTLKEVHLLSLDRVQEILSTLFPRSQPD